MSRNSFSNALRGPSIAYARNDKPRVLNHQIYRK